MPKSGIPTSTASTSRRSSPASAITAVTITVEPTPTHCATASSGCVICSTSREPSNAVPITTSANAAGGALNMIKSSSGAATPAVSSRTARLFFGKVRSDLTLPWQSDATHRRMRALTRRFARHLRSRGARARRPGAAGVSRAHARAPAARAHGREPRRLLGASVGGEVAPSALAWEPRGSALGELVLGRGVWFLVAPAPGRPRDLFRASVRLWPNGAAAHAVAPREPQPDPRRRREWPHRRRHSGAVRDARARARGGGDGARRERRRARPRFVGRFARRDRTLVTARAHGSAHRQTGELGVDQARRTSRHARARRRRGQPPLRPPSGAR